MFALPPPVGPVPSPFCGWIFLCSPRLWICHANAQRLLEISQSWRAPLGSWRAQSVGSWWSPGALLFFFFFRGGRKNSGNSGIEGLSVREELAWPVSCDVLLFSLAQSSEDLDFVGMGSLGNQMRRPWHFTDTQKGIPTEKMQRLIRHPQVEPRGCRAQPCSGTRVWWASNSRMAVIASSWFHGRQVKFRLAKKLLWCRVGNWKVGGLGTRESNWSASLGSCQRFVYATDHARRLTKRQATLQKSAVWCCARRDVCGRS